MHYEQLPRPRLIARNMIPICEKLMDGGDTALNLARDQQSPLRARRYDTHDARQENRAGDPGYNDQTGAVVCARVERKGSTLYDTFVSALRALDSSLTRVDSAYDKIMGKAKRSEVKRRNRAPGAGRCVACNEWMEGTRERRIREGFCHTHYVGLHRAKAKGMTRSEYISKVRRNKSLNLDEVLELDEDKDEV